MTDDLLYRIALTMIPELGPVRVKALIDYYGNAQAVFKANKKEISQIDTIGELCAKQLKNWNHFTEAEKEINYIEKNQISTLFITDPDYPQRLLHCYDPPSLLYYKGKQHLNNARMVSIIGTRNHTAYGKQVTEEFIRGLENEQVVIISGLALGIDAIAHKASLQHRIPTVGVLAHGLDTLYPSQHRSLASEMISNGGLLTEFRMLTQPDKHNFPRRNRIVAGMADATVVIETAIKGGSMITAELAYNYNRDLFAVPGKLTDSKSSGCLKLIQQNKALLFSGPEHFIDTMGWKEKKLVPKKQIDLFPDLSNEEKIILKLLQEKEMMPIDELNLKCGFSSSSLATAILHLELNSLICSLPGKMYKLL